MELRKVEQELERLSNEWKSLRRKNPFFDGENAGTESINGIVSSAATADVISGEPMQPATGTATLLPSLKELSLRIDDKDIYPTPPPESEDDESDTKMGVEVEGERKGTDGNLPECAAVEKSVIFKVDDSTKDSKPVENGTSATKVNSVEFDAQVETTQNQDASDNEEEEIKTMEAESPEKVLANLDFLRESILTLKAKNDKFCKRLIEKDPITKKPRYGDKTAIRVKKVIRRFKTLELGVSIAFNDPEFSDLNPTVSVQYNHMSDVSNSTTATEGLVAKLRMQIQQHNEKIQSKLHAKKTKELMEAERIARERVIAEQTIIEQQRLEEEKKREEELILAQRAQEMRQRRAEEEQRALEAEREADRQLLELVPVKGPEGVRVQLNRMRESLKDDKKALDVALGSLYTLFDQIVRKPEEVNFRRIRRDHPKFMEDIGRHVGGREILIAAGFHLEKLDGVPSFFSREPHIETDMDGWSAWFDGLKRTLEILEEEMIK